MFTNKSSKDQANMSSNQNEYDSANPRHHNYLTISDLSIVSPEGREIVTALSLSVQRGQRLAIIGAEGSGKSTLLKSIVGELPAGFSVSGKIALGKWGYLPQNLPAAWSDSSVSSYLLADSPAAVIDLERWNDSLKYITALRSVGLPQRLFDEDRAIATLSGGELIRLQLAKLVATNPDILILDEPSNHLDLKTLEWLETFLAREKRAIVFVSHDESLVENVATSILHLQYVTHRQKAVHTYTGEDYRSFLQTRQAAAERSEQVIDSERREKRRLKQQLSKALSKSQGRENRAEPEDKNTKNRAQRGLTHARERIAQLRDKLESLPSSEQMMLEESARLEFKPGSAVQKHKTLAELSIPELRAGNELLAENVALSVRGPCRIVITGDNGVGKTTLIREIVSKLCERGDLRVGYLPQKYEEVLTQPQKTAFEYLQEFEPSVSFSINTLIRLGLTAAEIRTPVSSLSGGQRAKVIIGRAICAAANILVLDEPTSNLSPLMVPAFTEALREFPGAIVVVSHDRKFITNLGGEVLKLTSKGLSRA